MTSHFKRDKIKKTILEATTSNSQKRNNSTGQKCRLYRREGQYIYFGRYQQSLKEDDVTVTQGIGDSKCVQNYPWYYTGSDGEIYVRGEKYYGSLTKVFYKVEPIKWRIIDEKDGVALLLCENILTAEYYGGHNCYWGSMLADWINEWFYETSFTEEERKIILPTLIDNSAESTGFEENADAGGDCEVYVFLLSYKEAFESYGLTDKDRQKQPTDYAESRWSNNAPCTDWYLRSPIPSKFSYLVRAVDENGKATDANVSEWYYGGSDGSDGASTGVVPAIRIRL